MSRSSSRTADPDASRSPAPSTSGDAVHDALGGYRLLRTIGSGSRSVVYLGAAHPGAGVAGDVAVKAVDADLPSRSFADEAACITMISSPHVVGLLDVSVTAGRPRCLILERVSGPTLATLLRDRSFIESGEAITLAVSIVRGVRAVHAAGWTHNAISLAKVRLGEGGRPILLGFGAAARETAALRQHDWISAADAIDHLFDRIDLADVARLAQCRNAVRAIASAGDDEASAVAMAQRELFGLGPAAPVGMPSVGVSSGAPSHATSSPRVSATARRSRHGRATATATATATASTTGTVGTRGADDRHEATGRGRRRAGALAFMVLSAMENGIASAVLTRARRLAHGRRRPLIVAVVAIVVITVGSLLLLPANGSDGYAAQDGADAVSAEPDPVPTRSIAGNGASRTRTTAKASQDAGEEISDEPVTAAAQLLSLRSSALTRGDVTALAACEQEGSPILAADTLLVVAGRQRTAAPVRSQLSLAETLGDAAVVAIAPGPTTTKPTSALLIRTDAGWRLRALFED